MNKMAVMHFQCRAVMVCYHPCTDATGNQTLEAHKITKSE